MKIQIGGLSEGLHHYDFEAEPSEVGLGERFHDRILVKTKLEKTGNQILLHAEITAPVVFACDRCTAEFEKSLTPSYQMLYVTEGADGPEGLDPSEIQLIPQGLSTIDISEDVRQTVLLAVPLKLLCSQSCKGLCPQCGKNLNEGLCSCTEETTDPRWEALRQIRNNN